MEVFAVKDLKADIYHRAFVVENVVEAERSFREVIGGKHGESIISNYPDDFNLYHIGSYNPDNGIIKGKEEKTMICEGREVYAGLRKEREE